MDVSSSTGQAGLLPLLPLLHAASMMLFPVTMGLATTRSLAGSPSPWSIVSVHEGVARRRALDRGWLAVAAAWLIPALAGGQAPALTAAALLLLAVLAAADLWYRSAPAAALAEAAAQVLADGPVTTVDDEGAIVGLRREAEGLPAPAGTDRAVAAYLAATVGSVALFVAVIVAAAEGVGDVARCVVLAGLWVSLGVLLVDLVEDSWPGLSTDESVMRTSRYYVQIFEQFPNYGVLVAFSVVLVGGPLAWLAGAVPGPVLAFPLWIGACLCFATFSNSVLVGRGILASPLPLPMYPNRYSTAHPLWAHFFAVIHSVMAAGLLAGIVALDGAMR